MSQGYKGPLGKKLERQQKHREMNTKQSKVKNVTGNGTWDSPHGLFYKFEYEMEDGTTLTAQHKENKSFQVGDEVEYEVKGTNAYGSYGKVSKPQEQPNTFNSRSNGFKDNSDAILYQVCLKGVMDHYTQTNNPQFETAFTVDGINDLALAIAIKAKENIQKLK